MLTIANKICHHFKKECGIALSLLIEIYDDRKFSSSYQDHISMCYDPGFNRLEVPEKEIKKRIIEDIAKEQITKQGICSKFIEIPPQKFIITFDRIHEPYTSAYVNNAGKCVEDPVIELQNTIDNKNKKYKTYIEKCYKCDLMVVSEDGSAGNFVLFSDKIKSLKFNSAFSNVYLLDLLSGKTIRLKTKFYEG